MDAKACAFLHPDKAWWDLCRFPCKSGQASLPSVTFPQQIVTAISVSAGRHLAPLPSAHPFPGMVDANRAHIFCSSLTPSPWDAGSAHALCSEERRAGWAGDASASSGWVGGAECHSPAPVCVCVGGVLHVCPWCGSGSAGPEKNQKAPPQAVGIGAWP